MQTRLPAVLDVNTTLLLPVIMSAGDLGTSLLVAADARGHDAVCSSSHPTDYMQHALSLSHDDYPRRQAPADPSKRLYTVDPPRSGSTDRSDPCSAKARITNPSRTRDANPVQHGAIRSIPSLACFPNPEGYPSQSLTRLDWTDFLYLVPMGFWRDFLHASYPANFAPPPHLYQHYRRFHKRCLTRTHAPPPWIPLSSTEFSLQRSRT